MIKNFLRIACLLLTSMAMQAQSVLPSLDLGTPERSALSIPAEFAYGNTPLLLMYENDEYGEATNQLNIYDEDLELVRQIQTPEVLSFDYTLTYQEQVREVKEVVMFYMEEKDYNMTFERFVQEQQYFFEPYFLDMIHIEVNEQGDSIITIVGLPETRSQSVYVSEKYRHLYFYYDYFGSQYPRLYWICSKGNVREIQAYYDVKYTDWTTKGTREEQRSKELSILRLCNINLNKGDGRANQYFEISQTLFNEDAVFEMLIPKYALSSNQNGSIAPGDSYTGLSLSRTICISDKRYPTLVGFQITTPEGQVLKDMDFAESLELSSSTDHVYVLTIGKNTYLAFHGNINEQESTLFYKIDKATSSIERVKSMPAGFTVTCYSANHSNQLTLELADENPSGSDIAIYSANGTMLQNHKMPPGERQVQTALNSQPGVYHITRRTTNSAPVTKSILLK